MRYGINLLLWTDDPTDERYLPLYGRLEKMGFDGVELPILAPDPEPFAKLGKRLDDLGLARTAVSVRAPEEDPISPDPAVRRAALETTKRVLDCCEASGATLLGGPLYAALGQFSGSAPTPEEWSRSVEVMRAAADYAAPKGITLALEFLNRFEIYLLNTAADTTRFCAEVERENCGVHYDTFHAHIEEKSVTAAVASAASNLAHVHISESDRGTPGQGQVRWEESFRALASSGYDGWLTIEAFGQALPALAAATKIWRPLFEDAEKLAAEGLVFMRRGWEAQRAGREEI